jgi:chromosome segregation ATPase
VWWVDRLISISRFKKMLSKEERQKRLESRLQERLEKERRKTERYLAVKSEDDRIKKLRKELDDLKAERGAKRKKVKIGGHTFSI